MTAAANQLELAKSAISRRLAELEQRLGVELFHRTTRKMTLTDTGRGFYERSRRILDDLSEAEHAVSQAHHELSGVLRIAAPLTFGLLHLGPAITEFATRHPGLQFDLDFNDRQIDLVQEGFDLGIRIAELRDSSLIARKLAEIHSVLCASPSYLNKYGTPQTPEDLLKHRCLEYSYVPPDEQWSFIDETGKIIRLKPVFALRANNGNYLRDAAIAGLGILHQPTFIAYQSIRNGELQPILQNYRFRVVNAYAIYPPTRHLSQRVRRFIDFLVERFSGTPYWDEPG